MWEQAPPHWICTRFGDHAPLQGTMNRHRARRQPLKPQPRRLKSDNRKHESPVFGAFAFWRIFRTNWQTWHAPAITLAQPSFGDLGTGRPRIPSLHPGCLMRTASRSHRFGEPWYRQAGDSLFSPKPLATPRFGALVQAGRELLLYTGAYGAQRPSPARGTLVQAGRGFPLLFLLEMDLQPPAAIDLLALPFAPQGPRRHQVSNKPASSCARASSHPCR
jgi:hypothetical protein